MQTYQNRRKAPDRAAPPAQEAAPSRSQLLHLSGAGAPQPMSPQLREKFEPGFCADFTNIRISRGRIPEEMGVQAVAQGTDILLDERAGMDVLGHELAHVVQQAQGRVAGGFPVVENAALEHEADVMGARAASGLTAQAGPQDGFGGETMAIAPMSEASAPAQCKVGKDKKKKGAAPAPQQAAPAPQQAAPAPAPAPVDPARQAAAAASAGQGMVSQRINSTPYALGPDTQLKALQGTGAMSLTAAAMQAAKDKGGDQSTIFQASGLRTNGQPAAKAVMERTGNVFAGLDEDIKEWGMGLQSQGMSWGKIAEDSEQGSQYFRGPGFRLSPDISQLSIGSMEIFDQYLDRPEAQQLMQDRYRLLSGTDVFDEDAQNGTQLDYMMTDVMNREFGIDAYRKLKDGLLLPMDIREAMR